MKWTPITNLPINNIGVAIHTDYWGSPVFKYGMNNFDMIEWDGRSEVEPHVRNVCLRFRDEFNRIGTLMNPDTFKTI